MALIAIQLSDGSTFWVNQFLVASVVDQVGSSPPASYVDIQGDAPTRVLAAGKAATVAASLNAGATVTDGEYTPTFTSSGNLGLIGSPPWRYSRVGQTVTVTGSLDISWTLAGGGSLDVTLPPGLPHSGNLNPGGCFTYGPRPLNAAPWAEPGGDMTLNVDPTKLTIAMVSLAGDPAEGGVVFQYTTTASP